MNNLFCNESRVEVLKKRVARCVCKYCGQPLTLKRIIFNDFEDIVSVSNMALNRKFMRVRLAL